MPTDISCDCKKCARLPPFLRYISRDLARKHLRKNGPALLVPARAIESDGTASSSAPQSSSNRLPTMPDDDLEPFDLPDSTEFDDPGTRNEDGPPQLHNGRPAFIERENVSTTPAPAPDDRYEEVIMPPCPDYGRDDPFDDDVAPIVPPAFTRGEPTAVRLAYLQAVYNNVFCNIPVSTTTDNLNMTLNALDAAGALPLVPPPVRTLTSAKKHLGIDPDAWIIPYTVCPRCWKLYTPHETENLASPACLYPGCVGTLYTESKDAKGRSKRRAVKILPQVSLLQSLRCMVRRKGFRKLVRDSRGAARNMNDDDDFVMKDMHDGSLWHDMSVGIKREVGNYGTVRDAPVSVGSRDRLTNKRFGLHLNGNLDWFGALENRPHSSGPIYVTIQDLQLSVRYLQVNTICVMVTPGPSEPTTEQLTNCMEPVMRDIRALKMGVSMEMYDEGDEDIIDEEVYADFICNNCDTPGARKFSGFASHNHDIHPCPWCRCLQVDVNKSEGYYYRDFQPRDNYDMLKQKYYSLTAPIQRQSAILRQISVSFDHSSAEPDEPYDDDDE